MLDLPQIYLASKSPRRRQLLKDCHIPFKSLDTEIDESKYPADLPVMQVAEYLAAEKAKEALPLVGDGIVLTADSIVICKGELLGKPADRNDAIRILRLLSDHRHEVVTGVCIQDSRKRILFSEISYVTLSPLTDTEIEFYIDQYKPYDKAGAYAIQEWIGLCKIGRIEGSYTNIMGLPTERVYRILKSWMMDHE